MFKSLVAFLLVPAISALQLNQPTTQIRSSSSANVTWTTTSGDPAKFDLYLTNVFYHSTRVLRHAITTADGTAEVFIPAGPVGCGYIFQAFPKGKVDTVLSETATFDIAVAPSPSPSFSSTSPPRTSTTTGTSPSTCTLLLSSPAGGHNDHIDGAPSTTGASGTIINVLFAACVVLGLW